MSGSHTQMWELEEVQRALKTATYEMTVTFGKLLFSLSFWDLCPEIQGLYTLLMHLEQCAFIWRESGKMPRREVKWQASILRWNIILFYVGKRITHKPAELIFFVRKVKGGWGREWNYNYPGHYLFPCCLFTYLHSETLKEETDIIATAGCHYFIVTQWEFIEYLPAVRDFPAIGWLLISDKKLFSNKLPFSQI